MRKTLLVGGDSWADQRCGSYRKTDILTWPILLAEKLGMDLVCVARSGAGNEQIYSSIFDWICENGTDDIGMVIAAWSKAERLDYEIPTKERSKFNFSPHSYVTSSWYNARVAPRGDIHGWIKKSVRNFYNLQLLCEFHNIPYKQFQMISLFTEYVSEYYHKTFKETRIDCINTLNNAVQFDLINEDNFIGWPIYNESGGFVIGDETTHSTFHHHNKLVNNNYRKGKDISLEYVISKLDMHPNKAGHELIMEFIYENL